LYESVSKQLGECCSTVSTTTDTSGGGGGTGTYTVIYLGNGNTAGTSPTDGSSPYNSGTTVTILGNSGSLSISGVAVFAGWNTAANGSGITYVGGNTFSINANTTLYSQWIPQL
jgi:hypothetical protein